MNAVILIPTSCTVADPHHLSKLNQRLRAVVVVAMKAELDKTGLLYVVGQDILV